MFINLDQKPKNKNPKIMFIKTRVATKTPRSLLINEGCELCEMGEGDERVVAL